MDLCKLTESAHFYYLTKVGSIVFIHLCVKLWSHLTAWARICPDLMRKACPGREIHIGSGGTFLTSEGVHQQPTRPPLEPTLHMQDIKMQTVGLEFGGRGAIRPPAASHLIRRYNKLQLAYYLFVVPQTCGPMQAD